MKLKDLFERGEFVISGEVGPVKGAIPRDENFVPPCLMEARQLNGSAHAINVTDNQSAVMKLGSLAACVRLKKNGFEPIYQITCRDRNRIALQSEILTAYSLGVDNMLLLTGDHTNLGDHKQAKPVFDLDSVQFVKIAAGLQAGRDMAGNPRCTSRTCSSGPWSIPISSRSSCSCSRCARRRKPGPSFSRLRRSMMMRPSMRLWRTPRASADPSSLGSWC